MKKIIAVLILSFSYMLSAQAASNIGQCVFPKVKVAKNGNLQFKKPISIYSAPDINSSKSTLTTLTGFSVAKEANDLVQLVEVAGADGSNARAGKSIGWAKLSDFDFQELRNCN